MEWLIPYIKCGFARVLASTLGVDPGQPNKVFPQASCPGGDIENCCQLSESFSTVLRLEIELNIDPDKTETDDARAARRRCRCTAAAANSACRAGSHPRVAICSCPRARLPLSEHIVVPLVSNPTNGFGRRACGQPSLTDVVKVFRAIEHAHLGPEPHSFF